VAPPPVFVKKRGRVDLKFIVPIDDAMADALTEFGLTPEFSLPKRVYYSCVRPILPLALRHVLQKLVKSSERRGEVCLFDDRLVERVRQTVGGSLDFVRSLYPEHYTSATVLTHDVETQEGFDFIPEVIKLEKRYGFKSSWNIVPYKYQIHEEILSHIRNEGHEIGIHGYNHDGRLFSSKREFDRRVPYINEALERYGAAGFRAPMVHRQLEWMQQLNIEYDASCFDCDAYQPFPGGCGSIWPFQAGRFVELPYTLLQDHTLFYLLMEKTADLWIKKVAWLRERHGVILPVTHPDYLREGDRLKVYEELLEHLNGIKDTWRVLPRELAAHFSKHWVVR
jgi:peptidoglycan/xylan/chitin deacetylase (PgdA/CDA1 family)